MDGNLIHAICKLIEISKSRTTPYRPRSNGQVERYNRLLLGMIRCCTEKANRNWDLYLPQLAAAVCSMVNRSTGFSANMLMLGREVTKPVDLVFGTTGEGTQDKSTPEYVKELRARMMHTHELAREHLRQNQARSK